MPLRPSRMIGSKPESRGIGAVAVGHQSIAIPLGVDTLTRRRLGTGFVG